MPKQNKPLVPKDVKCRTIKATRQPLHGHGADWIIEEGTNILLGSMGQGKQTDIYPYNKVFEIKVGI